MMTKYDTEQHKYGYCPMDIFIAQGHFKGVGLRHQMCLENKGR